MGDPTLSIPRLKASHQRETSSCAGPLSRRAGERGFTLIELLVVIAVLAVLAGVVVLNVAGVGSRGQSVSCQGDLKSVQTAVIAYYNDHNLTYPTGDGTIPGTVVMDDIVPAYLHTAPTSTGAVQLDVNATATAANC